METTYNRLYRDYRLYRVAGSLAKLTSVGTRTSRRRFPKEAISLTRSHSCVVLTDA